MHLEALALVLVAAAFHKQLVQADTREIAPPIVVALTASLSALAGGAVVGDSPATEEAIRRGQLLLMLQVVREQKCRFAP